VLPSVGSNGKRALPSSLGTALNRNPDPQVLPQDTIYMYSLKGRRPVGTLVLLTHLTGPKYCPIPTLSLTGSRIRPYWDQTKTTNSEAFSPQTNYTD
jgi:hypothetical protein